MGWGGLTRVSLGPCSMDVLDTQEGFAASTTQGSPWGEPYSHSAVAASHCAGTLGARLTPMHGKDSLTQASYILH